MLTMSKVTKITLKVSQETHQLLKKAQILLSHQQGKLLSLDETILQLCKKALE